jgi:glycosyltransferase involved in cell wall biosynthesis
VGLVASIRGSKATSTARAAPRARPALDVPSSSWETASASATSADPWARGLADRIVTGFRRDVPEVMAALDVLVLPSVRSEAFPQVIPQALAVGTPVIGTAVGGIPEIVRDGETGRLVPPADAAALAAAILDVLRDPGRARAMARRGQALVQERFTFEASMRATTAVYEELLRR